MNHYIAMDGGGTTCRLLLGTDDAILHHAQGESSNPYGVGWESAIRHVQSLITDSLEATGRDAKQVTALVLGSAGMGKPADQIRFASAIAPLLPNARIKVCGDQEIFLVGGLGGLSGIAVIAGTGSIACGRNEQGSVVRAGGFGWRLGDEGSAFWMAKEAIRRTLAASENRDIPSTLEGAILSFFHLENLQDAIYFVNDPTVEKATIASFAPFITKAAQHGDELALDIEQQGAKALVSLVLSIASRLSAPFSKAVVCGGGSFAHDPLLDKLFLSEMRHQLPSYTVSFTPVHSALEGAMILARSEESCT